MTFSGELTQMQRQFTWPNFEYGSPVWFNPSLTVTLPAHQHYFGNWLQIGMLFGRMMKLCLHIVSEEQTNDMHFQTALLSKQAVSAVITNVYWSVKKKNNIHAWPDRVIDVYWTPWTIMLIGREQKWEKQDLF